MFTSTENRRIKKCGPGSMIVTTSSEIEDKAVLAGSRCVVAILPASTTVSELKVFIAAAQKARDELYAACEKYPTPSRQPEKKATPRPRPRRSPVPPVRSYIGDYAFRQEPLFESITYANTWCIGEQSIVIVSSSTLEDVSLHTEANCIEVTYPDSASLSECIELMHAMVDAHVSQMKTQFESRQKSPATS